MDYSIDCGELRNRMIVAVTAGGTISALLGREKITIDNAGESALIARIKEVEAEQDVTIKVRPALGGASGSLGPEDWVKVAQVIESEHEAGAVRFIVTHGTDTLHYTAAFLAMQFAGWPLTIYVTGALFPWNHPQADGFANLKCSLVSLADKNHPNNVCVCFETLGVVGALTVMPPAFDELGYRLLYSHGLGARAARERAAMVENDIRGHRLPVLEERQMRRAKDEVMFVRLHPGIDLRHYSKIAFGAFIILEGFHSGTGSTRDDAESIIALRKGRPDVTICLCSIPSAFVERPYEASMMLAKEGVWVYWDVPPYAVFVGALIGKAQGLNAAEAFARFARWRLAV